MADALSLDMTLHFVTRDVSAVVVLLRRPRACSVTKALRCDVRVVSCVCSRMVGVVNPLSLIMTLHCVTRDVSAVVAQ